MITKIKTKIKKIDFKNLIIGFILGISLVSGGVFASNGTIGDLFQKVSGDWFLDGSNITNGSVSGDKIVNNSISPSKVQSSGNFTMGGLTVNGTARATSFLYTSDERLKENIVDIDNSLDKISSLRGVEWNWKSDGEKDMGFIAQEVEEILPYLVNTDEDGFKSVKYGNMIGLLLEGIKDLQSQNEELSRKIDNLTK